ncbi:MAG: helix-turn-helix domain-containing protein [Steroidobacteraceae bacterium]
MRRLRGMRGYTQKELGQRSRMCEGFLSNIENGRCNLELPTLAAVAEGLGCLVWELLWNSRRSKWIATGSVSMAEHNRWASSELRYQVGDNVKQLRRIRRYTQKELGTRSQMSENCVSDIETGSTNVTLATLEALSEGLGCQVWELVWSSRISERRWTINGSSEQQVSSDFRDNGPAGVLRSGPATLVHEPHKL